MCPAQPGEEILVVGDFCLLLFLFYRFVLFCFTRNICLCPMKFKSEAGPRRILIYAPVASKSWPASELQVSSGVLRQPGPKITEFATFLHRVAATGFILHNDVTK